MKKVFIVLFLLLFCFLFSYANLIDIYKKGKIKLVPDPNFGKGTAWDMYFPQGIMDIAFTKDGSFFATGLGNKAGHCVYKFDNNGKFIKKFGRKGRGPGDLYAPGDLSILDNKYLLIGEDALSRRISAFDLRGKFIRKIKTSCSIYDVVGLKNGNFAIFCRKYVKLNEFLIYKRDINSNNKKYVISFSEKARHCSVKAPKYYGNVFIRGMKNGEFLVGFNNLNKMNIYNFKGVKVKSFNINIKKTKITKEMKDNFYKIMEEAAKKHPFYKRVIKKMHSMDIFPEYAPYYENLIIDSDNNILVFYHNGHKKVRRLGFKVYSEEGKYFTDSEIQFNTPVLGGRDTHLYFHGKYLYYKVFKDDGYKLCRYKL